MEKKYLLFIFLICSLILTLPSCKSEFEKIRTSGNNASITKKAFEYYKDKEYQRAQTLFELVLPTLRGTKDAEEANFKYTYTHYYLENYTSAAYYFKNFANTFANSPLREEADYMSAYSSYKLSPTYRLDQANTLKAIDEFQIFINTYPESDRAKQANKLIDELRTKLEKKAFTEGQLYYDLKYYQSAIQSFENLLKEYPDSPDIERVRYMIVKSGFLWAENSVLEKQEERYKSTITSAEEFVNRYKSGKFTKEIKEILNNSNNKLKSIQLYERHQIKSSRT